ncbi:MAG: hypothetical protein K8L91_20095 [Anaerolineae bacterium]|nr:hypothetical protein [Anaerolineae bacterium]
MRKWLSALRKRSKVNRIQWVSPEGIAYLDVDGHLRFFDFETCYQNWLNQWMSPESLDEMRRNNNFDEQQLAAYIERRKLWPQVGERNAIGQPRPYIEFHTMPPVCFYFKDYKAFRKIADEVMKAGWQTFDLS